MMEVLQKYDKGQIFYWSSQALGSFGCLVVTMPKKLKTGLFQTFSTWHSTNLNCCCLGITEFCTVYPGSSPDDNYYDCDYDDGDDGYWLPGPFEGGSGRVLFQMWGCSVPGDTSSDMCHWKLLRRQNDIHENDYKDTIRVGGSTAP